MMENNVNESIPEQGDNLKNEVRTYTQEELDNKIFEIKKGMQSEIDRRVRSALETRENNLKTEFQVEKQSLIETNQSNEDKIANLTREIEKMKTESILNKNRIVAERELANAGIIGDEISSLIDNIVTVDSDKTMSVVNSILGIITNEKNKLNEKFDSQMSNVPKPKQQNNNGMTREQFLKLSFQEQLDFCNTNPTLANSIMNGGI